MGWPYTSPEGGRPRGEGVTEGPSPWAEYEDRLPLVDEGSWENVEEGAQHLGNQGKLGDDQRVEAGEQAPPVL